MPEEKTEYPVNAGLSPKDLRPADLDDVDRRILSLLHADARITNSALAEELEIAASTCHGRVRRLLDSGVIRGFYTDIDPVAVGLPLQAMISVSLQSNARGRIRDFIAQIRRRPQVMDVYFLAGADDFILHVAARDTEGTGYAAATASGSCTRSTAISSRARNRAGGITSLRRDRLWCPVRYGS